MLGLQAPLTLGSVLVSTMGLSWECHNLWLMSVIPLQMMQKLWTVRIHCSQEVIRRSEEELDNVEANGGRPSKPFLIAAHLTMGIEFHSKPRWVLINL